MKRLELSGLAVERGESPASEPPLTEQGAILSVRNAQLEVYIYRDRASRERDQARLDAARYLRPEDSAEGSALPTLVASENLLLIMASRRDRQRERITLAVTAGPPQP